MERKLPPLAHLQMTFVICSLPHPFPSSQYTDKPGCSGNFQGWLSPANPVPPSRYCSRLRFQHNEDSRLLRRALGPLQLLCPAAANGKAQVPTGAFYHSIASSPTLLSARALNYSDHSLPLWNVLISSSCPQRQS